MKRVLPSKTLSSDINGQIITALLKEYCCIFLDIQDVQHAITVLASYQRILKDSRRDIGGANKILKNMLCSVKAHFKRVYLNLKVLLHPSPTDSK